MTAAHWTGKQVEAMLALLRSIRTCHQLSAMTKAEIDTRLPEWEFHQREVELAEQQAKPGYVPMEPKIPPRRLNGDE